MLHEIRIYDKNGQLKKIISSSQASEEFWAKYWEEERNQKSSAITKKRKLEKIRKDVNRVVPDLLINGLMK